jgi:uncharacterized protein
MGERTQHAPGTFSWVDLSTTDPAAAKAFYSGLFGWEADDRPVGDGVFYSMLNLGGRLVAGLAAQPDTQREAGAPPAWQSYVTVESAQASADRAAELGASVLAGPFDVMDSGRMAVIRDPQGAFLNIWEPLAHPGAGLVNAPGALCWNELSTPDLEGSSAFYGGLFGWSTAPFEGSPDPYLAITNGDRANGGMREPSGSPGTPPFWLVYFAVEDLDESVAKVAELGGSVLAGPIDIQIATFAVLADPQGAVFALYAGQLDP